MIEKEDIILHTLHEDMGSDAINNVTKDLSASEWDYLFSFSMSHGIFPAFYRKLSDLKIENIPPDIREKYKQLYLSNLHRNMVMENEMFRVLSHLKKNNIPAIPLKGPVMAELLYKDIALRPAPCDMDILVPYEKVRETEKKLEEIDYIPFFESNFNEVEVNLLKRGYNLTLNQDMIDIMYKYRSELNFKKKSKASINIDLHWDFLGKFLNMRINDLWINAKEININKKNILMPSMEDLFFILMLASIAKYDYVPLKYIYDIHKLVITTGRDFNWDKLIEKVRKDKLEHVLYFTLCITEDLFKTPFPEKIIEKLKPDFLKEKILKKWLNKDIILNPENKISSSYIWRFLTVNYLYTDNFLDFIKLTCYRIFTPFSEGIELLLEQKAIKKFNKYFKKFIFTKKLVENL